MEPDDYYAVWRILSGPKVVWGTLQLPYPSREQWRKHLLDPPEGLISLVACDEDNNNEILGQLSLQTLGNRPRRRHAGQIGMAVRDDQQGKGIGSKLLQAAIDLADNWLNLRRLELEVFADNTAAIKLYKKFGFRIEGAMKEHAFRDGEYADTCIMARLKPKSKINRSK
jgi:putative acetyltransferase